MNAVSFRQPIRQPRCRITALILTGIVMTALPTLAALANASGTSARVFQQVEQQPADDNRATFLEVSLQEMPAMRTNTLGNNAVIQQHGTGNRGSVNQARSGQHDFGNVAWLYQNGWGNSADIHQAGGSNIGIVHQTGDGFTAAINQAGNALSAAVSQFGFNAQATVNQFGSASQGVSIEQWSRSGAGMTVTVETR